jgi:signal transduction histidine kinase
MQLIEEGLGRSIFKRIKQYYFIEDKFSLSIISLSIRQWLVLFAMGLAVIVIEVRSHTNMWLEHNSGQTILTDPELILEIILFGLVIPTLGGILLGYIGHTAEERDRMSKELESRRSLIRQISQAQSWDDLVEIIVKTPGTLTTADHTWLLTQLSGEKELTQIAYWERPEKESLLISEPVFPGICENCIKSSSLNGSRLITCAHLDSHGHDFSYTRHCLQLASIGTRKSALLFDVPLDRPLTPDQMKMLNELDTEISLAVDNANLNLNEQHQVDAARNERLRIARDLHDTLGQNVSYLRLQLEQLSTSKLASDGAEFQEVLANMSLVADEAYEQVRDTLEELRTTEHRGLEESVRSYAAQTGERVGFSIYVHASGDAKSLSGRQSRQVMYILREILNNVEKHAASQHVDIYLQWADEEFRLKVRDDGQGFNLEKPPREDAYGLAIMKERSRTINADLVIDSSVGSGTEVKLILPLSLSTSPTLKNQ